MVMCLQCGNQFGQGLSPSRLKTRKYCSRACMFAYAHDHPELHGSKPVHLTCSYCDHAYTTSPSRIRGKHGNYCSFECSQLARSPFLRSHPEALHDIASRTKACERCGSAFVCKPSHYERRRYCSEDCGRRAHKFNMRAEGNSNFRHGQNKRGAHDLALRTFPAKCMICGWNISVDVHHIEPRHNGGRNRVANLISFVRITIECPTLACLRLQS